MEPVFLNAEMAFYQVHSVTMQTLRMVTDALQPAPFSRAGLATIMRP